MERSQGVALAHLVLDVLGDEHALAELLAAVDQTVTDSVDLLIVADAAFFGVGETREDSLDGALVVDVAQLQDSLRAVAFLIFDEAVFQADFLDTALGENLLAVRVDEFVFGGTAAAVENKNFHCLYCMLIG